MDIIENYMTKNIYPLLLPLLAAAAEQQLFSLFLALENLISHIFDPYMLSFGDSIGDILTQNIKLIFTYQLASSTQH